MIAAKFFLGAYVALTFVTTASANKPSLADWLNLQKQISIDRIMRNISPAGTAPGTVIASPSKNTPNYYFHWIRDAGLTIDQVVSLYAAEKSKGNSKYLARIHEFIQLSERQQNDPGPEGFGEPRYLVDGSVDTIPWSRPQSDGPALRALALMRFLKLLPNTDPVYSQAKVIIKRDLQYVILSWQLPCFDLWEELKGLHFYTQAVQQTALSEGYQFFKGENEFSVQLLDAATLASYALEKYWDGEKSMIGASQNLELAPGSQYKVSNLDVAVILASIHSNDLTGKNHPLFFGAHLDRFVATAHLLEIEFTKIYPVNSKMNAPAIGRFSDDVYFGGNPWYMTTLAFAEFYYKVASTVQNSEDLKVTKHNIRFLQALVTAEKNSLQLAEGESISVQSALGQKIIKYLKLRGDDYIETVRQFTGSQGEMSEQFDRQAGVPVSAPDLTWSYASFLSALNARNALISTGK